VRRFTAEIFVGQGNPGHSHNNAQDRSITKICDVKLCAGSEAVFPLNALETAQTQSDKRL